MNHFRYKSFCLNGLLLSLIMTSVMVCDDNPASSKKNPKADATVTIDETGGVLEIDDLVLTISAGTFSSPVKLTVTADEEDIFSENPVTRSIIIEGLPSSFFKSLRLSIRYLETLSDDSYIVMGTQNWCLFEDDSLINYVFFQASDSSGFLNCEIPPQDYGEYELSRTQGLPKKLSGNQVRFCGVTNYQSNIEHNNFSINYPKDMQSYVPQIKQLLISCCEIATDQLGFSWNNYNHILPIQVNVLASEAMSNQFTHAQGVYSGILDSEDMNYCLTINKNSLLSNQIDYLKQDIGKELVLNFLCLYGGVKKFIMKRDYYWLAAAIHHWSEEFFTDPASFTAPRRFVNNEMMPFRGFCTGARDQYFGPDRHSRGMSAVIKYLSDDPSYGIKGPARTYEMIRTGTPAPTVLICTVDRLLAEWWPGFFHDYVDGEVYQVNDSFFLDSDVICRTWKIDDDQHEEHTFYSSDLDGYDDLSAKIFLVDLDYSKLAHGDNLLIDAISNGVNDNGLAVIVFGVKNSKLHFLGEQINGDAAVTLSDLKDFYDNNWRQFLVVVVNSFGEPPYDGKSHIDLKLKIQHTSPPDFTSCKVRIKCHCYYVREYSNGHSENWDVDNTLEIYNFNEGSFDGNSFRADYVYKNTPHTYTREGSITVTLSTNQDSVAFFTWNDLKTYVENDEAEETISINAEKIPLEPDYYGATAFIVRGETIVNHITQFSHIQDWGSYGSRLINYEGNENSGIFVFFR
ncbi:MAG: hypothetical protein JXQ65_09185 [Candidatus Marinimicrobia bacterium]|nr:hypothetical protein [Candidatus Neomarinimicrobiota bacterium]